MYMLIICITFVFSFIIKADLIKTFVEDFNGNDAVKKYTSNGYYNSGSNRYDNEREEGGGGGNRYNKNDGGGGGGRFNSNRRGDRNDDGENHYEKRDRNGGDRYEKRDRNGGGGGFKPRDRGDRNNDGEGYERNDRGRDRNGGGGFERRDRGDRNNDGEGYERNNRGRDHGNGEDGDRRRRGGDRNGEGGEDGEQKPREFYIPPEPTSDEEEMFKNGISTGINFDKYEKIPIKVSGNNPPEKITSFEESGLRDFVLANITKSGYTKPTPIQKTAIPIIIGGRDLMACAQTGSGKTAAFLLPIINQLLTDNRDMSVRKPHAVIVSPTRELSIQIYNEALKFAKGSYIKVAIVYGGTSTKHQSEKVEKGCHILICTPGRLLDFVDRGLISFEDTRFAVLDEADRMLDMGFLEPMRRMLNHDSMPSAPDRQTLMFSATFPEDIQRLAAEFLNDYIFITIGVVGGACADVLQTIYEVSKSTKRTKLSEILNESSDGVLVFVETKRSADFLASYFSESDFPTTSIHGDRLQSQREKALADFRSGKMKVLIATSVAARGLDIKHISHVVNYDLPNNIDDYVHRIGRTGRVGNNGRATSFYCPETDSLMAAPLVRILEEVGQEVPDFLRAAAGGGGGGGSYNNRFGGRDVRKDLNSAADGPAALEEEESWE